MTTTTKASETVRELIAELAATEEELQALRLEPVTLEVRARRREVLQRQARVVAVLRRRRSAA